MEQIKITINGKEIIGNKGDTVLNIAAANGIEIPNLCYNGNLKIYGACGICVVEAEGIPKLLRACSAVATDGMVISTNSPRVKRARNIALELIMSDHEGDCAGPCHLNCPAHTDIQGYLKQIALGNDSEAVKIIKEKISIPASIGRVCPHPCETHCRRALVEEPLSIAFLKAFAADNDRAIPMRLKSLNQRAKRLRLSAAVLQVLMRHTISALQVTMLQFTKLCPKWEVCSATAFPNTDSPRLCLQAKLNSLQKRALL